MQPDVLGAGSNFTNAFADYDNDGDLDMFVGFDGKPNRLYRNDKGMFTDVAAAAGVADARPTRAAAWGDFDADGDPDLLLGFTPLKDASVLKLYRNNAGTFADATGDAGLMVPTGAVRQPAWIDFDARRRSRSLHRLPRSRQRAVSQRRRQARPTSPRRSASTTSAAPSAPCGSTTTKTAISTWPSPTWTATRTACSATTPASSPTSPKPPAWRGAAARRSSPANGTVRVCAADVDSDGKFDLFAANYGPLGFFSNRGKGAFEDRSAAWQIAIDSRYDACAFADFDHDGRLDLYVNGTVTGGASWQDSLFRNTGSAFVDVTPAPIRKLQADHGVQWADVDGDGDLDLALTGSRADGMHLVMRNMLPAADAARGLHVRVVDCQGPRHPRRRRSARVCGRHDAARSARGWSTAAPATTRRTTCRCTSACRQACRASTCR